MISSLPRSSMNMCKFGKIFYNVLIFFFKKYQKFALVSGIDLLWMEKTISWTQSNIFLEGNMSHRVNASSPYGVHPYSPWFFGWLDICSLLFHECSRSLEHYNRYNLYCWYNMYSSRVNIVASDALAVKNVWAWNIMVATVQGCRQCFSILSTTQRQLRDYKQQN